MALSERLAYILDFDTKGGVRSLEKLGNSADKELGKVDKRIDKIGGGLTKFGAGALAFAGVAGGALVKMAGDASDLEESVNAVNVTFGESADGILELGEKAATALGLAKAEFNGLAVQFSNFANTVAGPGGDVVQVMDDLTTRASDFASVMNLDVAEAARVFQSGSAGETEPLKKFGIDLSAAAVEAYALENGLAASKAEMTESVKVTARYGLLMESTAQMHGDFANTADGAANSQRIMRAELKNMSAEIGAGALPAITKLVGMVRDGIAVFNKFNDATGGSAGEIATYGVAAVGAVGGVSLLAGQVIKMRNAFTNTDGSITTLGKSMKRATVIALALGAAYGALQAVSAGLSGDTEWLHREVSLLEKPFQMAGRLGYYIGGGYESAEHAIRGFDQAADEAFASVTDGVFTMEQLQRRLEASSLSLEVRNRITIKFRAELDRQAEAEANLAEAMGETADATDEATTATEASMTAMDAIADSIALAKSNVKRFGSDGVEAMNDVEDATEDAIDPVEALEEAFADLKDEMSDRSAWLDVEDAIDDFEQAVIDAKAAEEEFGAGSREAAAANREVERSLMARKQAVIDYLLELEDVPPETVTEIRAMLDRGSVDEAEAAIARLERNRTVVITARTIVRNAPSSAFSQPNQGRGGIGAEGAVVNRPTWSLIGEAGPEALVPLDKLPGNQPIESVLGGVGSSSSGAVININVTAGMGANGPEISRIIVDEIRKFERRNGPGWRQ